MTTCQICKKSKVKTISDFGPQPLCNRFLIDLDAEEYRHPLVLGQCETCGLIQLTLPVPDGEIAPRFEWLTYNEPEGHLDHLADVICALPGITDKSLACGITSKDDTILRRLEKRKFRQTWRIDPERDLGITIHGAGGETVQAGLTQESVANLANKHGLADVVIARHIYEHASDTHRLLNALKKLVTPNGYVVFEVPDCTQVLVGRDYSMPWEEHILYFTPKTFQKSFGFTDFSLIHYECYPYRVENALVAITHVTENNKSTPLTRDELAYESALGESYGKGVDEYAEKLQQYLKAYKKTKGKAAVFGAGHLACIYINLMGIRDYIEFVVDDNPNKAGLYMPGSRLPIRSSQSLTDEQISLCLLSLNPESEAKVMQKNKAYIEQGGAFVSIFPTSKNRLDL